MEANADHDIKKSAPNDQNCLLTLYQTTNFQTGPK